jgi:hypothetical protein
MIPNRPNSVKDCVFYGCVPVVGRSPAFDPVVAHAAAVSAAAAASFAAFLSAAFFFFLFCELSLVNH